jgi:hypothetical protein
MRAWLPTTSLFFCALRIQCRLSAICWRISSERFFQHRLQHVPGNAVAGGQVLRVAAAANPTERPEAVVEAHRPHDVLHVARVAEFFTVLATDIGSGAFASSRKALP